MNACIQLFFPQNHFPVELYLKSELNISSFLSLTKFSIQRYLYDNFKIKGGNIGKMALIFPHRPFKVIITKDHQFSSQN